MMVPVFTERVSRRAERRSGPSPLDRRGDVALRGGAIAESDDVVLAAMLVERDPWAQRIAWQRLSPTVRRMCMRVLGPQGEIDDLVQEIFLVFFRRVHALRDPRAMKAFVVSITAMVIRGVLRRKASTRVLYFPDPPDAVVVPADLDSRRALDRLNRILDRLNPVERTAFVLRFVEGQELSAISMCLGVSVATATRRVARAWRRVAFHSQRDAALVDHVACRSVRGQS
jgi:RNA polymerase sigma-70 factor (ECF subfamily)